MPLRAAQANGYPHISIRGDNDAAPSAAFGATRYLGSTCDYDWRIPVATVMVVNTDFGALRSFIRQQH